MLISPQGFYDFRYKGKSKEEKDLIIKELKKEIETLETYIKEEKECLTKPDYKARLSNNKNILKFIEEAEKQN